MPIRSLLLLTALIFAAAACSEDAPPEAGAGGGASASSGATPAPAPSAYALPPAPRTPPDKLHARVVEHLEGLHFIGLPLTKDHCDVFGEDMNAYLDHYKQDFTEAAKIDLTNAQRQAIQDAYSKSSEVTTRCLQDAAGRRFNQRLLNLTKPLRPRK